MKKLSQLQRVLLKLMLGPCKNYQFVKHHNIYRYSARICELRVNKLVINSKRLGKGVWEYTLKTPLSLIDHKKCKLIEMQG